MARVSIPDINQSIADPNRIKEFLAPFGIRYERWDTDDCRVSDNCSEQDILSAYSPEIERLKKEGGYVTADVINVNRETPGLDAMLAKFDKEHTHSEDEVRFVV